MRSVLRAVCAALFAGTGLAAQGPAGAPGTTPALSAARIPNGSPGPALDGRLDDAAWRLATPIDDLRQRVESIESRRTPLGDQSPPAKDLLNRLYEQMLADSM